MQSISSYAKDYDDFSVPIDLVDEHGVCAHMLDVSLTAVATPGSILLEWNGGTADVPNRAPNTDGNGLQELHAIRRDQVVIGYVRKILATDGIAVVRAHFANKARP